MDANGDAWLYGNEAKSVNSNIEAAAGTAINSLVHREIKGGHQDAGDFDRRDFHIAPITTYLASYIFWPQNFYDGQCDVEEPELLGIPDILREAMWNIKTYVDSQEEDGGCHTWFEAKAHPDMIVENPIRHYPYDE